MPAKNRLKQYVPDSYYHIYNRGVEKRSIFRDAQDYAVFLSYLKTYLLPKDVPGLTAILSNPSSPAKEKSDATKLLRLNNFSESLTLCAFCLMPNHFHLLVRQREDQTIDAFMNSFATRYTMFFNKKHKRVGSLYQGIYKAVLVESDEQLLHITRYIHRNSQSLGPIADYPYSSYAYFLGKLLVPWIDPVPILSYFRKSSKTRYQEFVEDISINDSSFEVISTITLDPSE